MPILIEARFAFHLPVPTDVLLQFEAAEIPEQKILANSTRLSTSEHCARVPAQDEIGERIWIRAEGNFEVAYRAKVELTRQLEPLENFAALSPHNMPGGTVEYLFDSRYCPADAFQPFVDARFSNLSGGARIAAIRDWIYDNFTYVPGSSTTATGAAESFIVREGICRDYAHMLVTLARASTIPARYVACYAPGVDPPDFHAVAEVFLADPYTPDGGIWQIVDATGMADPADTVKIGVGRDAADVSFLTSFGPNDFRSSSVRVTKE
ncbi:transglutaminase-like domain-containing protein [Qipengyuania qiaonensis]|uniref:Transglutaminase domain-containing protein n=1 Tax=Qipengyuania qiaonensis TaxID=2867240 RepID=A0ABS7JDS8_9SPHN|nr:transglutaminase domain-containing protein [Qipengyuania qiaonensis]MBX7483838.1 transglutaminase domain-containing protein [Qipengyuania qiaonensis]